MLLTERTRFNVYSYPSLLLINVGARATNFLKLHVCTRSVSWKYNDALDLDSGSRCMASEIPGHKVFCNTRWRCSSPTQDTISLTLSSLINLEAFLAVLIASAQVREVTPTWAWSQLQSAGDCFWHLEWQHLLSSVLRHTTYPYLLAFLRATLIHASCKPQIVSTAGPSGFKGTERISRHVVMDHCNWL